MMSSSSSASKTLQIYRGLLRALRHYPSTKRNNIANAVKQDFRENRSLSGQPLEKALWLAQMELKRLQTWIPTSKQVGNGGDIHLQL